jgi:L-lactate dehydrogenase complex protein LldE
LLRVEKPPRKLLSALIGTDLHMLSVDCCGFGGVFAVDHGPISAHMLDYRLRQIEAIRPDLVVACDVSCLMHLEGGLRKLGSEIRCTHLAPLLVDREAALK